MKKARNLSSTRHNEEERWAVLDSNGSVVDGYYLRESHAFEVARYLAAHNPSNEYTVVKLLSSTRTGSGQVHVTTYYGY